MSDEELTPEEALLKQHRKEKKDLQVNFLKTYTYQICDAILSEIYFQGNGERGNAGLELGTKPAAFVCKHGTTVGNL